MYAGVFTERPLEPHRDVLPDRQVEVRRLLKQDGLVRLLRRQTSTTRELNADRAARGREQSGEQLDQRALARAIGSDDRRGACGKCVRDLRQGALVAVRVPVAHALQMDRQDFGRPHVYRPLIGAQPSPAPATRWGDWPAAGGLSPWDSQTIGARSQRPAR